MWALSGAQLSQKLPHRCCTCTGAGHTHFLGAPSVLAFGSLRHRLQLQLRLRLRLRRRLCKSEAQLGGERRQKAEQ